MTRRARAAVLCVASAVLASPAAHACQACFGAADSPIIDGAKAGAWILIGLTLSIEGAFAGFFIYLRRRARRASGTTLGSCIQEPRQDTRWS